MSFFRSKLLPALIVLLFALALFAVSARIWLPGDMLAPSADGLSPGMPPVASPHD